MAKESRSTEAYRVSAEQLYSQTKNRKVIPCTLSSDIGLNGGIPLGATVLISGLPKTGKTTFVLQCAANANKLYKTPIFFFPIEGRFTNQILDQIRNLDREAITVILPPVITDKKGEVLGHKKWHAQQWWTEIGNTIIENPGSIIIIDSISNMSSEKEQSEGMGYQGRGDTQKLEAQFCRMYGDLIIANNVTVFFIAQIQANTSGYGPPIQPKAGNSVKHQADVILSCKGIEKWQESDGRIKGHTINMMIQTSALGPPHVEVNLPLRYSYGIDNIKDIITHAVTWGLIQKNGSWYVLPFIKDKEPKVVEIQDNKEIEYFKFQGEENIWSWLNNPQNHQYFLALENAIKEKLLV